jgi:alpha-1,2-mannosyltransferase
VTEVYLALQVETRGIERWIVAVIGMAIIAAILAPPLFSIGKWTAIAAVIVCFALIPTIASKLPKALRGGLKRHPILSIVWLMIGILTVFQMGRLSAFMADPSRIWGSTVPDPAAIGHQCMSAYVQAADLARRREPNLYAEKFYPAFGRQSGIKPPELASSVQGLSAYLEDPYQYPPQFLILPRSALALTNHFLTIRTVWFVLQSLTLIAGVIFLGIWIGVDEVMLTMLMLPALLSSLPVMLNFQFGQFHAMTVILAIAGMVAFEKQRTVTGSVFLGFAILAKIFPALLLVYLVAQRRWREILWTFIFVVVFSGLSLAILGVAPLKAFLSFELPRLMNGQAFTFIDREGLPLFIKARNFSIYGFIVKLRLLGISGLTDTVFKLLQWVYMIVILVLTFFAARKHSNSSRLIKAQMWISILVLVSLRSPVAPSAYVVVPALFLLALLAGEIHGRIIYGFGFFLAWILIMGVSRLPDRPELIVDLISQSLTMALCIWVLVRRPQTQQMPDAGYQIPVAT